MWSAPKRSNRAPALLVVGLLHVGLVHALVLRVQHNATAPEPLPLMTRIIPPEPRPLDPAPAVPPPPKQKISMPKLDVVAAPEIEIAHQSNNTLALAAVTEPPVQAKVAEVSAPPSQPAPITPPRSDASHLNNPPPTYPGISRKLGEQGRVLLLVYIHPDGHVSDVKLKKSSGYDRLDQAALDAVKRWKYVPARQGDTAIAFWHTQPVDFALT